jgi:hypothetical protein
LIGSLQTSLSIDGEDALYVSVIASESIIVLPVPSLSVRNNLVRRFQAFIKVGNLTTISPTRFYVVIVVFVFVLCLRHQVHRDWESLDQDSPTIFHHSFVAKKQRQETVEEKERRRLRQREKRHQMRAEVELEGVPVSAKSTSSKSAAGRSQQASAKLTSSKKMLSVPHTAPTSSSSVTAFKRGYSTPQDQIRDSSGNVTNSVFSHNKPLRSVSFIRRSSQSSKASFSESLLSLREPSLDYF